MNIVHNCDCMDFMETIENLKYGITITSPPYNMNLRYGNGKLTSRLPHATDVTSKYKKFDDNLSMDEYYIFLDKIIGKLIRISRVTFFNIQILNGNKAAIYRILGKYAENIKDIIIWDKGNGIPSIQEHCMNARFEMIFIFSDKEYSMYRSFKDTNFKQGTLDNLWEIKRERSYNIEHKAVFPRKLVTDILMNFATIGDTIFDPFTGSGQTRIVCHDMGFDFEGCELDKDYWNAQEERYKNHTKQNELFSKEEIQRGIF